MVDANFLAQYSDEALNTLRDSELSQRLGLYQVFVKLYEQNHGLLDEILNLENTGNKSLSMVKTPFIQGMVLGEYTYLVTNVIGGHTQALMQPQGVWTIGRDSKQVVLAIHDRRLSRRHAAIRYANGQFQLSDLGSSNGTYVNGELVRHPVTLKDGDRIRFGSLTFAFSICQHIRVLDPVPAELLTERTWMDGPGQPAATAGNQTSNQPSTQASTQALSEAINQAISEAGSQMLLPPSSSAIAPSESPAADLPNDDTLLFLRMEHHSAQSADKS
ncbi:MAG TPA: FHA domain-containing protein [Chroococcidiopsis sp.]